jgi:hypothetical protein
MTLVAIAWGYVVLMLALVQASGPGGSLLAAFVTLVLYGALPLAVLIYISGGKTRRQAAIARERLASDASAAGSDSVDPGGGGQAAAEAVAPEREEA